SYVDTGACLAVQAAGAAVLHDAEAHLRPYVAQFRERRDAMLPALRAQGFEPETPRATMYIWVPLPEGLPSAAFQRRALEEAGVVVMPGSGFGAGGGGFLRVAVRVATPPAAGGGPRGRPPAPGGGRSRARARVPAVAARRGPAGHDARGEPRRGGPTPGRAAASGGRPAVGVAAARAPRGGGGRLVRGTRPARLGRRGAAAGDGGHPEPPARLAPDRAQAALLDRERGGGEVRDRRVEHLHRADPHPDRGAGAARKPVAAGQLRRLAAGAPARGHADGPVAGRAPRRGGGPCQGRRDGAAGAEAGGAGVRTPGAWGYDQGSGGYAGSVAPGLSARHTPGGRFPQPLERRLLSYHVEQFIH